MLLTTSEMRYLADPAQSTRTSDVGRERVVMMMLDFLGANRNRLSYIDAGSWGDSDKTIVADIV